MKGNIKILISLLDKVDYFDPDEDIYDIRKQLVRSNEISSLVLTYIEELYEELLKQKTYCFKQSELNDVILYINKFQRLKKIKLIKNIK
jgi:hypothetical protein